MFYIFEFIILKVWFTVFFLCPSYPTDTWAAPSRNTPIAGSDRRPGEGPGWAGAGNACGHLLALSPALVLGQERAPGMRLVMLPCNKCFRIIKTVDACKGSCMPGGIRRTLTGLFNSWFIPHKADTRGKCKKLIKTKKKKKKKKQKSLLRTLK